LHTRKSCDRGLAVIFDDLNVRSEFSEQWTHDPLRLIEHRAEEMFRFNLLILIAFGQLDTGLNRFLSSECEFV